MPTPTANTVRVSSPPEIYSKLLIPCTTDGSIAIRGLAVTLGIEHVPASLESFVFQPALGESISEAMIAHPSARRRKHEVDTPQAIVERVTTIMKQYPWLQVLAGLEENEVRIHQLSEETLRACIARGMPENYPGMFGITAAEGQVLRKQLIPVYATTPS